MLEDVYPPFTDFPPDDLLEALVSAYFREVNAFTPLLHEPLFRTGLQRGLHRTDGAFGATVLLVCSNGAAWVRDLRTRCILECMKL